MATSKKSSKSLIPVRKAAPRKTGAAKAGPKAARKPSTPLVPRPVAVKPLAVPKPDKPKKPKLVRDSFTIPKNEFTVLQGLKQRAGRSGTAAKKSEILRAGIKALAAMNDSAFAAALGAVPTIKTGRPAKA